MEKTNETVEILNDLILINNDRIAGYEKALKELQEDDDDLTAIFESMIDQSRQARMALGSEVQALGGTMAEGTMTSGKIYRAWMDVKALFTGHDRHTVLSNCESGEDAAQKAYETALKHDDLPSYIRDLVSQQKTSLRQSHDEIRSFRDSEVVH